MACGGNPICRISTNTGSWITLTSRSTPRVFNSSVFPNAPAGLAFAGDPQYACANGYNCSDYNKFFPRIGFVLDPRGDGKMTIRASYGMFGDRLHQFFPNQMGFGPPFGNNIGLSNVNLSNPWASYPGGNAIPYLVNCSPVGHARHDCTFPTAGAYVRFNTDDYKAMYTHQWNLSIQRQVGDWLLSANYIGNTSIHLGTSENINPAVFLGLGPCTLNTVSAPARLCQRTSRRVRRPLTKISGGLYLQNPLAGQYYSGIGAYDPGGTGSYNGLYLSANKRLKHNITMNTNYTWSHCISDLYDQQTGSGWSLAVYSPEWTQQLCWGRPAAIFCFEYGGPVTPLRQHLASPPGERLAGCADLDFADPDSTSASYREPIVH